MSAACKFAGMQGWPLVRRAPGPAAPRYSGRRGRSRFPHCDQRQYRDQREGDEGDHDVTEHQPDHSQLARDQPDAEGDHDCGRDDIIHASLLVLKPVLPAVYRLDLGELTLKYYHNNKKLKMI